MVDITPFRADPKPAQPEMVDVLLINGQLNSGHVFDYAIRADLGDRYEDAGDYVVLRNGSNGQEIRITKSQIALLSTVTRQMPRELPKLKKETHEPR